MKHLIKIIFISILFIFTGIFSLSGQKKINNESNYEPINLISSDVDTSYLKSEINKIEFTEINTGTIRGKMKAVKIKDGVSICKKGAPDLQRISTSLIIPDNGKMEVNIISSEYKEYKNIDIIPSRGTIFIGQDLENIPFEFGKEYKTDKFFPGKLAKLRKPHIFRSLRGQVIDIYPLQYNPLTRTLRMYTEITVEIFVNNDKTGENCISINDKHRTNADFKDIYKNLYINYSSINSREDTYDANGRMLIISDGNFIDAMQPFIDWKILKGIETEIIDVSNIGDADAIKTYVADYYNNNNDLAYLILVGDFQQVPSITENQVQGYPSFMDPGPYAADNPYAMITGNDNYPEILCGRISAETVSEVETQVEKFTTYEKHPEQLNIARFDNASVFSVKESPNGGDVYPDMQDVKTYLINGGYEECVELYEQGYGDLEPTATNISNTINEGQGFLAWISHGDETSLTSFDFSTSDLDALSNTDMWPMIWNCSCMNGKYHKEGNGPCFAEAWMRGENNGESTGAIGVSMNNLMMEDGLSEEYPREAASRLTDNERSNKTYGGITYDTYIKVALEDYNNPTQFKYNILFGDPSLLLRTKEPMSMIVSHDATANIGFSQLTINCDAEGAYIAITDDNIIMGTGYVNNGFVTITFDPVNNPDTLQITATAFNYSPYLGSIAVIQATGEYTYSSSVITENISVYPNPAKDDINILFSLEEPSYVKASITNISGSETYMILDEITYKKGKHLSNIDTKGYPSGIYMINIIINKNIYHKKIIIL